MDITILIVEDELPIRQMVSFALRRSGFKPVEAATIAEANEILTCQTVQLILLDCMMPDKSGINWLTKLKKNPSFQLPVIMLTARAEEANKIRAFDAGADDYITKPFSPKELLARINAVLRRSYQNMSIIENTIPPKSEPLTADGIVLDIDNHRLILNGKKTKIGPLEFKLLHYLMRHPDKALSREKLLDKVWGDQADVLERTVDVHIRRVRKILERENLEYLIESVRGIGYRFNAEPKQ
ncbi:response regulator [Thiotrichales bacterium 19S3-7]|nr:response regulator [Thiotrichales bacterium 19S3-7]MCF6800582.1 response regulator [Thiotrichales bacterium 19S3-11]